MQEYRQDPLTGRMVIVASERASRPHQFDIENQSEPVGAAGYRPACPFCEGNESATPGELDAFRPTGCSPDTPGWSVRVVPNKYPAVVRKDELFPDHATFHKHYLLPPSIEQARHRLDGSLTQTIPAVGNHEVIIDTPRHVLSVTDMTESELADMFRMYAQRLTRLRAENRWSSVQIFKNVGEAAGASIPHSHSQLIAMPFMAPAFYRTLQEASRYRQQGSDRPCYWCDMVRHEIQQQERLIEQTDYFVALCPFVSRFAGEVEIYPKRHESSVEYISSESQWTEMAQLLKGIILRLEQAVPWLQGRLAYNFVLHTEPFESPFSDSENLFHWHLSILPALARAAGFEWGTGLHINPIAPEEAAKRLRTK